MINYGALYFDHYTKFRIMGDYIEIFMVIDGAFNSSGYIWLHA
ncbi:hypothetical protein [Lysinibacillus xylanilyticus]|uniref:Uncharacterized protein n=1 Tax=Lysinibacillus xylanilyticus TaxID=582475 RepID=A0ABV3VXW4_9BACI